MIVVLMQFRMVLVKNVPVMTQKMTHCESWKKKVVEMDPLEEMLQEVEVALELTA